MLPAPAAFSFPLHASEHIRLEHLPEMRTLLLTVCAQPRPCVTRQVIDGLMATAALVRAANAEAPETVRHIVVRSENPDVFSLGGDLDLFLTCIRNGDRAQLLRYALDCVRIGHVFHNGIEGTVTTTAVIAGQAMGGGLEGAACCQTIVVEQGSTLQLPEIKFGMFPGMGAISYLSRRIPGVQVRRMVEEGEPVDLEQAYAARLFDALPPRGEGLRTAFAINARLDAAFHGHVATRHALAQAQGPQLAELEAIAASWVECAFKVERRDMRLMGRLASQQLRLPRRPQVPALPLPGRPVPLRGAETRRRLPPATPLLI